MNSFIIDGLFVALPIVAECREVRNGRMSGEQWSGQDREGTRR
jgi:hypothetical protein